MREEQKIQFFAMKSGTPHTVRVEGKFGFKSLPKEMQSVIKKRLVEKDKLMLKGLHGEFPGIKINGRQVTRDNLHEFEIKPKKIEKESNLDSKGLNKEDLIKMSFSKLKELAEKFGETGRSKSGLIKDILKHK